MGCGLAIVVTWLLVWGTNAPWYVWMPALVLLPDCLGRWLAAIEKVVKE